MINERRSRPRPVLDSKNSTMSNAELDAAIRELNKKVEALMAERRSRNIESTSSPEVDQTPASHTP